MKIVFRCDATAQTGLGHLSRSLALAEVARSHGHSALFFGHWGSAAYPLMSASGFPFRHLTAPSGTAQDADELADLASADAADGILADCYAIDAAWVARLAACGAALALLDDFARLADYRGCAGVLNFTVAAKAQSYRGLEPRHLALGPEFFPARENLRRLRETGRIWPKIAPQRVLITLGGGDRMAQTVQIYQAVRKGRPTIEVRALTAEGPRQAAALGLNLEHFPPLAGDLSVHYGWADACITGGGLVKYECAYLGLPMAIFSQTPEQQEETDVFCCKGLGWDLAPRGDADGWEDRLESFLNQQPPTPLSDTFRPDSPDRALDALLRFFTDRIASSPLLHGLT